MIKLIIKIIAFMLFIFFPKLNANNIIDNENHFVILITSYNNIKWYKKNLDTILEQNYKNYKIIYVDDCSSDGTTKAVEEYIKKYDINKKITLIKNNLQKLKMANVYHTIHKHCVDDDIVLIMDGDDWFSCNNVLQRINKEYLNKNIWATYGNYIDKYADKEEISPMSIIPKEIIGKNYFRKENKYSVPGHPFTFYASIFKKIKLKDLLHEGKILPSASDCGFVTAVIEMAINNHAFIPDILYIHNLMNELNDYKVNAAIQGNIAVYLTKEKPSYNAIESRSINTQKIKCDLIIKSIYDQDFINNLSKHLNNINKIHLLNVIDFSKLNIEKDVTHYCYLNKKIVFNKNIDLHDCIQFMNQTYAYAFLLNNNIINCQNYNIINENIIAVQYKYLNNISDQENGIYSTENFSNIIKQSNYSNNEEICLMFNN